jgi:aspartokinase-like uncharacterized kinase
MSMLIKVGGSLFDLPDLRQRLQSFLERIVDHPVFLFPGGGPAAQVIRRYDECHGLGEEAAHWLALRMLTVNAHFLADLLPGVPVMKEPVATSRAIVDPYASAIADEANPDSLPHVWGVTSDSLAVRAAVQYGAGELVVLKSAPLPTGSTWAEAARLGLVDAYFTEALANARNLQVRWVNLRTWRP